jgi:hypothetical protein
MPSMSQSKDIDYQIGLKNKTQPFLPYKNTSHWEKQTLA